MGTRWKRRIGRNLRYANANVKYTPSIRIRKTRAVTSTTQELILNRNEGRGDWG